MPFMYRNYELTEEINLRRPVKMPFFDRYFTSRRNLAGDMVAVDFTDGPEGLQIAINENTQSLPIVRGSTTRKFFQTPRFSEHGFIGLDEQHMYTAPGTVNGSVAFEQLVTELLDELRRRSDRTLEHMCQQQIFTGVMSDGAGTALHTFALPAKVNVDLAAQAGVDMFLDVRRDTSRILGDPMARVDCYIGDVALRALSSNSVVLAMQSEQAKQTQFGEDGYVTRISGIPINPIWGTYTDNAGSEQNWLGDNEVVFVSPDAQFRCYYGAIAGRGGRKLMVPYYVQTTEHDDPNKTKVRAEHKPLPIMNRLDLIRRYTHVAS